MIEIIEKIEKSSIMKKKCVICENEFEYDSKYKRERNKKTCSISCSGKLGALNAEKVEINCKICKKDFKLTKHKIQKDGNYCSDACRKKKFKSNCFVCNKEYRTDRKGTKYCSEKCNKIGTKRKMVKCNCDCCGVEFERPSFTVASNKRAFCSKKCGQRQFARENPNRYGSRWSRIRERKVKKDNYTCNRCKKQTFEPYGLNVHHIVPIEEFSIIEEAHIESNLETLCYECHMEHHDREFIKE